MRERERECVCVCVCVCGVVRLVSVILCMHVCVFCLCIFAGVRVSV